VALVGLLGMIVGSSLGGKLTHPVAPVDKTSRAMAADRPLPPAMLTAKQAG
jgi:hypothetical protein